ncbi:MAG: hypothetical protein BMS9Abin09_0843 [Gammaproteobacteria bacterium]|nr:MAG: hypothetical protein BMS9Abin09_0843 [Gammaproteobacteria bacterium]
MNRNSAQDKLVKKIAGLTPSPGHPALAHLVESLKDRHGSCVASVLFYGSCLRSGDPYDGLVDLYLIVDRYRCANSGWIKAAWNWLLPPNVFYAEFAHEGRMVRCKYAILSLSDLEKGTSPRWFHSYLWGRFSQPTAVAWCRDATARDRVEHSLARSVTTFLNRVLPSLPPQGSVQSMWGNGLQLSYGAELRVESSARSRELFEANKTYYQQVTSLSATLLDYPLTISETPEAMDYLARIPPGRRLISRVGWKIRTLLGKFLSLARLIKALFTFDGGLDYIAWKLERHSGVHIEIPDRVRRYPLIFIWGLFLDLYRRGVFR